MLIHQWCCESLGTLRKLDTPTTGCSQHPKPTQCCRKDENIWQLNDMVDVWMSYPAPHKTLIFDGKWPATDRQNEGATHRIVASQFWTRFSAVDDQFLIIKITIQRVKKIGTKGYLKCRTVFHHWAPLTSRTFDFTTLTIKHSQMWKSTGKTAVWSTNYKACHGFNLLTMRISKMETGFHGDFPHQGEPKGVKPPPKHRRRARSVTRPPRWDAQPHQLLGEMGTQRLTRPESIELHGARCFWWRMVTMVHHGESWLEMLRMTRSNMVLLKNDNVQSLQLTARNASYLTVLWISYAS